MRYSGKIQAGPDFSRFASGMSGQHFVRVGVLGSVGRFAAADRQRYARGMRVICRTPRGLEVGEVLSSVDAAAGVDCDGSLLRRVTTQDDLLIARLDKNRDEAHSHEEPVLILNAFEAFFQTGHRFDCVTFERDIRVVCHRFLRLLRLKG